MSAPDPFVPRCLPVSAWPAALRHTWETAFDDGDLFAAAKPAAAWRPATVRKNAAAIGVFVSWCRQRGIGEDSPLPQLVTRERVEAFHDDLLATGAAPYTILARFEGLHDSLRVMAPQIDWAWLRTAVRRIRKAAGPVRTKLNRVQHAADLEELGQALMDAADCDPDLSEFERALAYRDGLMLALLIRRPLRLANFAAITIGTELKIEGGIAQLVFTAAQMKNRRPLEVPFPPQLMTRLRRYLLVFRPYLLSLRRQPAEAGEKALWISRKGGRLSQVSLRAAVKNRTLVRFGTDMTPHLFRDSAVTSLVRDAPASARLTRDLLGHSSTDITTRHYNQARMIGSAKRNAALFDSLSGHPPQTP